MRSKPDYPSRVYYKWSKDGFVILGPKADVKKLAVISLFYIFLLKLVNPIVMFFSSFIFWGRR
jgi:hypothetical protein